jgi:macrolide transport system ATP-binding/permease protein
MLSRFHRWIVRVVAPPDQREWMLADLEDESAARARTGGPDAARQWLRRQVLASAGPLLRRRLESTVTESRRLFMNILSGLSGDIVLGFRRLRDAPVFAVICIATLAIGIGGNAAVFTLIDRVLLKRLPVPQAEELYRVGETNACCVNAGLAGSFSLFSYNLYQHLRDAAPEFTELAAFQANTRAITVGRPQGDAPAETLNGSFVSGNYFQMLRLTPAAGRLAMPTDDLPGAAPVAILSHTAWTRRFGARHDVAGTAVLLNGVPGTIVGVAPDGFYGETMRPNPPEVWIPLANEPQLQPAARLLEAPASHWLYVMGRLRPNTAIEPIQARLTSTLQHWLTTRLTLTPELTAEIARQHVKIVSAAVGVRSMRDEVAPALQLLQTMAAVVLLIACANLANLLLARGLARRGETAVRVALGAPRGRLIAQSMVESLVLACLGGSLGLLVSFGGAHAIIDIAMPGTSLPVDPIPSGAVLAFATGLSLLTALVFGAAPAVLGSRPDPIEALRGSGRSTVARGSTLRRSLVALQIALSLVLIAAAGLLGRSLNNLQDQDFGFQTDHRYVAEFAPSISVIPGEELPTIYARIRERLQQIPGLNHAAFSLYSPMSGDNWASGVLTDRTTESQVASYNRISPGYFETTGTAIVRGRAVDERDRVDTPRVAVVSETFAKKFFGDADPIGRRIGFGGARGSGAANMEIVGVVKDAKYQDGKAPAYPTFFMPFLQRATTVRVEGAPPQRLDRSHYPQALVVQTASTVQGLEGEVRRALTDVDRRLIVRSMMPLEEQVLRHFTLERLSSRLTVVFGAVALLLACLGLYGVTSQSVQRRTREIGIRMAIGATRSQVFETVLREAGVQLLVGVLLGVPAAFAAGKLLESYLYQVSGRDPWILVAAIGVLATCAIAAALIPARRAAHLDPVQALRVE